MRQDRHRHGLHLAETGSTNADLSGLAAREPGADRLWLSAGMQRAGRGRRGREWVSPQGNLHASVLLADPAPASELGFLPLVAALAAHDAIAAVLPEAAPPLHLKWPNDVLLSGAKCCGILLERTVTGHVVAGFGINLAAAPQDTPYPATSLRAHGAVADAGTLLAALAEALAARLQAFDRGAGKAALRDVWLDCATGIGGPVSVRLHDEVVTGIFEAVDGEGLLLLRMADGTPKRIAAGDVFFARTGS